MDRTEMQQMELLSFRVLIYKMYVAVIVSLLDLMSWTSGGECFQPMKSQE